MVFLSNNNIKKLQHFQLFLINLLNDTLQEIYEVHLKIFLSIFGNRCLN